MGNLYSFETKLKCKRLECKFDIITYQSIIIYPYIIDYKDITEHVKANVLCKYFDNAYHYSGYTYIIFNSCENCIIEDLKKYMKYNKEGYTRWKLNSN